MIASVDKKFVLLCNPKTGTTSLEAAFRPFAEIVVGKNPKWKHINYVALRGMFGSYFDDHGCTIYAVVRNPVDTLVSWYKYRARESLRSPTHRSHANYTGHLTFAEFVESWASENPLPCARVSNPVNWSMNTDGTAAPISFFRYESTERLVDALAEHVGRRPKVGRLNASPPITVDFDREAISALPKMRRQLRLYESIPFVA